MADFENLTNENEIKERFNKMEHVSYCSNLTLDALLSLKKSEALQHGIKIKYEICDLENITVTDFDLCSVVSNLLDNAIRAAKETDEKHVGMVINKKLGRLIITVKNSSLPVENLSTTKNDKENHGMGIMQLNSIAEKYNGDTVFKYADGEFTGIVNLVNKI